MVKKNFFERRGFVRMLIALLTCLNLSCKKAGLADLLAGSQEPSFTINNSETSTTKTSAVLKVVAGDYSEMAIFRNSDCSGTPSWESAVSEKPWTLAANSNNQISLLFRKTEKSGFTNSSCLAKSIVHDDTAPALTISAPAANSPITRAWVDANLPILNGTCDTSETFITFSGAVTGFSPCLEGVWALVHNLSNVADGSINIVVNQKDKAGNSYSVSRTLLKVTTPPLAPVITTPAASPSGSFPNLILSGTCTNGLIIDLSGDSTATFVCASGAFSFPISKGTAGTYNFSVKSIDAYGNESAAVAHVWNRPASGPTAPTVSSPALASTTNNQSSFSISGTCTNGNTVVLGGDVVASDVSVPVSSLELLCSGGAYAFTINKSTDATYNFTVLQRLNGADSSTVSRTWIRDTSEPNTTIATQPLDPNPYKTATFTFTSSKPGSTFECNLQNAGWTICPTPYTLSNPTNTLLTLQVRAKDTLGNRDSTPATSTWLQAGYNTVLSYNFDNPNNLNDQSLFSSTYSQNLTGNATSTTGRWSEGRNFASASSQSLSSFHSEAHSTARSRMTVEFWFRVATLPAAGTRQILVSKSGTGTNRGWFIALENNAGTYRFNFDGSLNGTTGTRVNSTAATVAINTWYHLALTFDLGNVAFYQGGVARGTGTIGTPGSSVLYNSNADFRLGVTSDMTGGNVYLNGIIDDLRWSQTIRYSGAFTAPTAALTVD